MLKLLKKIIALGLFCLAIPHAQQAAAPVPAGANIRTPIVLGGVLGFGSGTGVGSDRGLGLYQVSPIVGIWYPRIGFLRVGYGFYNFNANAEDSKYEVDHSAMDIELGVHLLGDIYVKGLYSRVGELSDIGDVAWNEWGVGFGTLLTLFSKSIFFAEIGYHRILNHFDPFENRNIHGSRLQLNFGFAAYVY